MARISLRGLSKRFPPRDRGDAAPPALVGLDLDVADGELLVLVGPSGCGKSTALRLIAGLEEPSAGSIELDDRDLAGVPPQQRDVAMVFQGYALYPHLTVREIMAFPLEMRGQPRAERDAKVADIARMIGLSDKLDRLPSELSGGERQRVAMGRAIVRSPQIFLFDEPLSNLDAKLRAELRVELVALLRRLGTTAIYVTHDQAEAMTMGDRVAVMQRGELMQLGTPRAIYTDPDNLFVAGFVGSPSMNLVELERVDGAYVVGGARIEVPGWLGDDAELTIGFRPEHVTLAPSPDAAWSLSAEVYAVEPMGAETFVHLRSDALSLCARVAGFGGPPIGDEVTMSVRQALWFDRRSGRRLRPSDGPSDGQSSKKGAT